MNVALRARPILVLVALALSSPPEAHSDGAPGDTATVTVPGVSVTANRSPESALRTPAAVQRWAVAIIRLRPSLRCNGRLYQPN